MDDDRPLAGPAPPHRPGDTVISGHDFDLRPASVDDEPWLRQAAGEPSVATWWDTGDGARWVDDLGDDEDVHGFVIELSEHRRVGFVQWYEEDDPGYRHAAIDIFLTTAAQGGGLGTAVLRTLARWLIDERGHHRLEIDPSAANERAIRCYERVGFRRVGVARRRERGADGAWRDSLLLDLLADELT